MHASTSHSSSHQPASHRTVPTVEQLFHYATERSVAMDLDRATQPSVTSGPEVILDGGD